MMTYYILSLLNDKSFNSCEAQCNAEYIPSLEQIYNIFNRVIRIDEDEDEDEDERLFIKSKKISK